jgi:hypothetical protein
LVKAISASASQIIECFGSDAGTDERGFQEIMSKQNKSAFPTPDAFDAVGNICYTGAPGLTKLEYFALPIYVQYISQFAPGGGPAPGVLATYAINDAKALMSELEKHQ